MVVEDNPSDIHLLKMAFEEAKLHFEITSFEDGEAALRQISSASSPLPDAIVLDVNLPKAEGGEILNALKASPRFSCIPVVALSSSSAPHDIERMKALGADCYLVKPVDLDEFLKIGDAVKECIEQARAARGGL